MWLRFALPSMILIELKLNPYFFQAQLNSQKTFLITQKLNHETFNLKTLKRTFHVS
jgi:hypothetical protein